MSELQMKTRNLEIYCEVPLYIFSSRDLSDSKWALQPFLIELTGDRIWKIRFSACLWLGLCETLSIGKDTFSMCFILGYKRTDSFSCAVP